MKCKMSENDLDDFFVLLAEGVENSSHNRTGTLQNSCALHSVFRNNFSNCNFGQEGENEDLFVSADSGHLCSVVPARKDDNCPIRNETIAISTLNISQAHPALHKELHPQLHKKMQNSSSLQMTQRCGEVNNSSVMSALLLSQQQHDNNDEHNQSPSLFTPSSTLTKNDINGTTQVLTAHESKLTCFTTPSFSLATSFTENEMKCIDTYLTCVCTSPSSFSMSSFEGSSSTLFHHDRIVPSSSSLYPAPIEEKSLFSQSISFASNCKATTELLVSKPHPSSSSPTLLDISFPQAQPELHEVPQLALHTSCTIPSSSCSPSPNVEEEEGISPSCQIEIRIPHSSSPVKITKPKKLQRKKSISIAHPGASFVKENPWQFHTYVKGKRQHTNNLVFYHFNPKVSNIK